MTQQIQLMPGNVIQIQGKPGVFIITGFYNRKDEDCLRGDSYYVDEFEAVRMSASAFADNVNHFTKFEEEVGKTHYFYFTDGSMSGRGEGVPRSSIKLIGTLKLTERVSRTLVLSGYKEVK